ncbi:MAG: cytochrome c biogenesis protein CcsA, partial [Gemmatimonadetes bacterium]|nr:cytochrome c biogenesis protein CcsA [Gemmatimonadota bacterium]
WWVWEPRLTLTLLLWFIYIGYFVLRGATDNPERGKRFAAVLGVVGAVDIPLIHVSVNWFRSQHPQAVILRPEGPTAGPEIVITLLVSLLAFTLTFFALLLFRYGLEKLRHHADAVRFAAESPRQAAPVGGGVA